MPGDQRSASDLALVLSGGGARAAYQVGLLRCLAERCPELSVPIITGVSAGAVNAAFLAAHPGGLAEAVDELSRLWSRLRVQDVFRSSTWHLGRDALRWALRLVSGGRRIGRQTRGLLDTRPLDRLLCRELATVDGEIPGIGRNLEAEKLKAVALTTLNYTTGQTVTWVQGSEIEAWERPSRRSVRTHLSVDHVMASSALPLIFPAVRLADGWHGDGGIRLAAPLSPAVHLGARRILAVSTRFQRSREESELPTSHYPPPAQIAGKLLNAIFLDVLDQDARRLERINELVRELPPERCRGMREIDILVLRPSQDLGKLAADYEPDLPRAFRFLTRGLGTRETTSPDFLSLLMFQPDYLKRLLALGEADAREQCDRIVELACGRAPASA